MKMNAKMTKQYTIRGVSLPVDAALRRLAKQHNTSINEVLVMSLEKFTGVSSKESNDLGRFAGAIPLEPKVAEALADQRSVSEEDWQ